MKQIELEIIENKIKYNNLIKVNDKDLKNQYITVKKEIKELDNLLTNITIKVEIIEKELLYQYNHIPQDSKKFREKRLIKNIRWIFYIYKRNIINKFNRR